MFTYCLKCCFCGFGCSLFNNSYGSFKTCPYNNINVTLIFFPSAFCGDKYLSFYLFINFLSVREKVSKLFVNFFYLWESLYFLSKLLLKFLSILSAKNKIRYPFTNIRSLKDIRSLKNWTKLQFLFEDLQCLNYGKCIYHLWNSSPALAWSDH